MAQVAVRRFCVMKRDVARRGIVCAMARPTLADRWLGASFGALALGVCAVIAWVVANLVTDQERLLWPWLVVGITIGAVVGACMPRVASRVGKVFVRIAHLFTAAA